VVVIVEEMDVDLLMFVAPGGRMGRASRGQRGHRERKPTDEQPRRGHGHGEDTATGRTLPRRGHGHGEDTATEKTRPRRGHGHGEDTATERRRPRRGDGHGEDTAEWKGRRRFLTMRERNKARQEKERGVKDR